MTLPSDDYFPVPIVFGGMLDDDQTSITYRPSTGEIGVDAPAGLLLTSINISSARGLFAGDAQNLSGDYDIFSPEAIFKNTFSGGFGSLSFGRIYPPGRSAAETVDDLSVVGSLQGGIDLGPVDLVYLDTRRFRNMALTPDQLQTLANDLSANTDQTVIDALAANNNNAIRDWYNTTASPDFWVLLDQLDVDDAIEAMDWATDYAVFKDDLTAFLLLFRNGSYAIRGPGARGALNEVLTGANTSKNAILTAATRIATRAEKLYATTATGPGGGDGSAQAQSANTNFTGDITAQDVDLARELMA